MQKTPTLSKKNKYACIRILTSVYTIIKQNKKKNMHAYLFFNICETPSFTKKVNMHAYIIDMHRITLNMHKMVLLQMVPHTFLKSVNK